MYLDTYGHLVHVFYGVCMFSVLFAFIFIFFLPAMFEHMSGVGECERGCEVLLRRGEVMSGGE